MAAQTGSRAPEGTWSHTWLLVDHIEQEEEDDSDGNESGPPGKQEHDDHRDHCPEQRHPLAVVAEGGSPPWTGPGQCTCPWSGAFSFAELQ